VSVLSWGHLDELELVVVVAVVPVPDDFEPPCVAARAAPPPPRATTAAADARATLRVGRNTLYLLSARGFACRHGSGPG
jgi:hypothetical protein